MLHLQSRGPLEYSAGNKQKFQNKKMHTFRQKDRTSSIYCSVLFLTVPMLISHSKKQNSWQSDVANINKYILPIYFKWLFIINFYKMYYNHINPSSLICL